MEVKSEDRFLVNQQQAFSVRSPICCIRNEKEFIKRVGEKINIDGKEYKILNVQMWMPVMKLQKNEPITLIVEQC